MKGVAFIREIAFRCIKLESQVKISNDIFLSSVNRVKSQCILSIKSCCICILDEKKSRGSSPILLEKIFDWPKFEIT